MGLAPRVLLGRAVVRALPPSPRVVLAPHPHRQARHGPLRPGDRAPDARAAHGRRAGGDGPGGIELRGAHRRVRRRSDVRALRRDLSREDARARHGRDLRQAPMGSRLPLGTDARGARSLLPAHPRRLGRADRHRGSRADDGERPGVSGVVGDLPADGREPGRRAGADAHERRDRHPRHPARRFACRRSSFIAVTITC